MSVVRVENGIEFEIRGRTLVKMTGIKEGDVCIPHEIDGITITTLGSYFLKGGSIFDRIIVDDNIAFIEPMAFALADAKEVVWPKGCRTIPSKCFAMSKIKVLSNIYDVNEVKREAFQHCNIPHLVWPSRCYRIPAKCFLKANIGRISNIGHVETVGSEAFMGAVIKELEWPASCYTIPSGCFWNSSVERVLNIENVVRIKESAFRESKLKEFTVPQKVKKLSPYVFCGASQLESVVIHDNITQIEPCAFAHTNISDINWPKKCKKVPGGCFANCLKLKEIQLPGAIEAIGDGAFMDSGIVRLEWPSKCKTIPLSCFSRSNIEEITNISHIEKIESNAFFVCNKLKRLDLSSLIACEIEKGAFRFLDKDKVTLPYYMSIEDTDTLF